MTHTVGIIMNGVTGRMGLNQHLRRSIAAIIGQGGIRLDGGERILPKPLLVGRNASKLQAISESCGGLPWTTDLDVALGDAAYSVYFDAQTTDRRADAVRRAIAARKHVYCEKPVAGDLATALDLYQRARAAGVKHGVVQDKLWLPGLLKLAKLRDDGFFGRILSVRGEFGYWVFEGDRVQPQRPSWNYRKEDGGGIILDMLCHWRYVLDNLFGKVKAVSCLGATAHPPEVERSRQALRLHRRRCRLRHLRAGGRRGGPLQLVLVRARAPRRPVDLAGGRHRGLRRGGPARVLEAAVCRDAASGVEPRRGKPAELLRGMGEGGRFRGSSTTRSRRSGSCSCATW